MNLTELERLAREARIIHFVPMTGKNNIEPETILALISALKAAREALDYYSKPLPWKDVERKVNFCSDDCPNGCDDHWAKFPTKTRSVGHDMKPAREALATLSSVCEGKKEKV